MGPLANLFRAFGMDPNKCRRTDLFDETPTVSKIVQTPCNLTHKTAKKSQSADLPAIFSIPDRIVVVPRKSFQHKIGPKNRTASTMTKMRNLDTSNICLTAADKKVHWKGKCVTDQHCRQEKSSSITAYIKTDSSSLKAAKLDGGNMTEALCGRGISTDTEPKGRNAANVRHPKLRKDKQGQSFVNCSENSSSRLKAFTASKSEENLGRTFKVAEEHSSATVLDVKNNTCGYLSVAFSVSVTPSESLLTGRANEGSEADAKTPALNNSLSKVPESFESVVFQPKLTTDEEQVFVNANSKVSPAKVKGFTASEDDEGNLGKFNVAEDHLSATGMDVESRTEGYRSKDDLKIVIRSELQSTGRNQTTAGSVLKCKTQAVRASTGTVTASFASTVGQPEGQLTENISPRPLVSVTAGDHEEDIFVNFNVVEQNGPTTAVLDSGKSAARCISGEEYPAVISTGTLLENGSEESVASTCVDHIIDLPLTLSVSLERDNPLNTVSNASSNNSFLFHPALSPPDPNVKTTKRRIRAEHNRGEPSKRRSGQRPRIDFSPFPALHCNKRKQPYYTPPVYCMNFRFF